MSAPEVWLVRHGETEWSRDGRHTSRTDLPLTGAGVEQARRLARALAGVRFDLVLTSPRRRAADTVALLRPDGPAAEVDPDLVEWDYGDYEGRTTADIRTDVPGWRIWTHPTAGGETAEAVGARADRVVARVLDAGAERVMLASHGHFLRVLGARWVEAAPVFGMRLLLDTATVCILGWERETRALTLWNSHAGPGPGRP
jgi:broad specificity phosphatase PhoE